MKNITFILVYFYYYFTFNYSLVNSERFRRSFGSSLRSIGNSFSLTSTPLFSCPTGHILYRYDRKRKECYEVGSQGPCGHNMIFYAESDNEEYGSCDCAHAHEDRTLVYHSPTDQCYFIFEKGYCYFGQWLTFNTFTRRPTCVTNPCLKFAPANLLNSYVQYEGRCVKLNSPCGVGKIVKFLPDIIQPRCSSSSATSHAVGSPVQTCKPGSYLAFNGRCQPKFVW